MSSAQEKQIDQALKRLDPDLFLDKEWNRDRGYMYYAVKYRIAGGEPMLCVSWDSPMGPRNLSMDIVDKVASQEHDVRESLKTAIVENAARRELQRQKLAENLDETSKDFERSQGRTYYLSRHPEKAQTLEKGSDQDP